MIAPTIDTAQLPRTSPPASLAATVPAAPTMPAPRARRGRHGTRHALRWARRLERRRRRLYALAGVSVLVAFLTATVAVLDMVR
jgi:hypothetical protein